MAASESVSMQRYTDTAAGFFQSIDPGATSPEGKKTEGSRGTNGKGATAISLDDVLQIAVRARSADDLAAAVGTAGQRFVVDQFQDALREEVRESIATPSKSAETTGFFPNIIQWIGESKAGKIFALGKADVTKTVTPQLPGPAGGSSSPLTGSPASFVSNLIGTAYGAFDLITNFGNLSPAHGALSGLTVGAGIGSIIAPGIGTAVGGLIGAAVGGLLSLFKKSGKDKDQRTRDQMRKALQEAGIIDQAFTIGLADGSRFDIGIDGKPKAAFGGLHPFDVDLKNPLAVKMATYLLPLTLLVCGGNRKLASDLSGYLTNASLSNAGGDELKARENVRAIYSQFKVPADKLVGGLASLASAGVISESLANGYVSALKDLFSQNQVKSTTLPVASEAGRAQN